METPEANDLKQMEVWAVVLQKTLDGTADTDERQWLTAAMRRDPALRRIYREQMDAHIRLRPSVDRELQRRLDVLFASKRRRFSFPRLSRGALRMAATLAVLLGLVALAVTIGEIRNRGTNAPGGRPARAVPAASSEPEPRMDTKKHESAAPVLGASSSTASTPSLLSTDFSTEKPEITSMHTRALTNTLVATASAVVLATATPRTASAENEPAVWTYTPGSPGTITDGSNWTLNVSNPNDTERTLTLGNGTAKNNIYVAGSGSLDLSDVVCRTSGGTDYVITALTGNGFNGNKAVTNLALPSLIRMIPSGFAGGGCTITGDLARIVNPAVTNIGYQAFYSRYQGVHIKGDVVLTNIAYISTEAFDSAGLTSVTLGGPSMTFDTGAFVRTPLTNVTFIAPQPTRFGGSAFSSCTSLQRISLSNVVSMGTSVFSGCQGLKDVRIQSATLTALRGSTFDMYSCSLTNVVLDMPALTNIESSAFSGYNSYTIGNLFIGAPNAITVASGALGTTRRFTRITFLGKAPDRAALDNLVTNTASGTSTHGCTFFASTRQTGWLDLASPLIETETANAPAKCFGVYTNNLGRKAWMVNQASPYDPKGTFIVIQ